MESSAVLSAGFRTINFSLLENKNPLKPEARSLQGPRSGKAGDLEKLRERVQCFKILRRKSSKFKGYSKTALDRLRAAIEGGIDVEAVWQKHRHRFVGRKRK